MSKFKTDDMFTKDRLTALCEQNGGNVNVQHRSTGIGKQGEWILTIDWDDALDGMTFLKALRHYDEPLRFEIA